jgi:hypothetical protein
VSQRFTDNGDGTVLDNATGLIWLAEANCFGVGNWDHGLNSANALADGACGLSDGSLAGDWRLPNARELHSLADFGRSFPAFPADHPFSGLQPNYYWTSTTREGQADRAWLVGFHEGGLWDSRYHPKIRIGYVWPVRTALQAPAPDCHAAGVLRTGQTACWNLTGLPVTCGGTGQDGEIQAGLSVSPRFTDNGNGTVKDNATGLVWLTQANCFGSEEWEFALQSANTLADGACSLEDGSEPGDWRLPNARELHSLIDYGHIFPALPPGHPFVGVVWQRYWSSTTLRSAPDRAWIVGLNIGGIWDGRDNCTIQCTSGLKYIPSHTWPVRVDR